MKLTQSINKATALLKGCLKDIPFLVFGGVKEFTSKTRLKKIKTLQIKYLSKLWNLLILTSPSGQPRAVRAALGELMGAQLKNNNTYIVIVAPYVTPQTAKLLANENIGFADLSGNCRLCFGGVHVEKSGNPNTAIIRREQRTVFSAKAARVLRVMLSDTKKSWGVVDLAKTAGISLGHVSAVRKLLLDREWAQVSKTGIVLVKPKEALTEWSRVYEDFIKNERSDLYTVKNLAEMEFALATYCKTKKITYALTGFSAADRYAPMVRSNRMMIYISGDISKDYDKLGLKKVSAGANVLLINPADEGVYYGAQNIDGITVVSPLQAYLDLINVKGRGEEAAQAILERKVSPLW